MGISFTKKALIILIASVVLTMFIVTAFYLSFVSPMFQARTVAENQLLTEQKMLELLHEQEAEQEEEIAEQTTQLQRKLPVDPLIDQLLLDIQRVEALSNTYILDMNFVKGRPANLVEGGTNEEEEVEVGDTSETIRQVSVDLSIIANSYEDLFQFLAEIDRLPRIVSIESISFVGPDENIMIDNQTDSLHFLVAISTYYYPDLQQLREELPKVDHPEPSGKTNPLYNR